MNSLLGVQSDVNKQRSVTVTSYDSYHMARTVISCQAKTQLKVPVKAVSEEVSRKCNICRSCRPLAFLKAILVLSLYRGFPLAIAASPPMHFFLSSDPSPSVRPSVTLASSSLSVCTALALDRWNGREHEISLLAHARTDPSVILANSCSPLRDGGGYTRSSHTSHTEQQQRAAAALWSNRGWQAAGAAAAVARCGGGTGVTRPAAV